MLQLRTVNKAIRQIDPNLELVKGDGYFYFIYDDQAGVFETRSIMVNSLNELELSHYIDDALNFVAHLFEAA